jgi:hypothetical protein
MTVVATVVGIVVRLSWPEPFLGHQCPPCPSLPGCRRHLCRCTQRMAPDRLDAPDRRDFVVGQPPAVIRTAGHDSRPVSRKRDGQLSTGVEPVQPVIRGPSYVPRPPLGA